MINFGNSTKNNTFIDLDVLIFGNSSDSQNQQLLKEQISILKNMTMIQGDVYEQEKILNKAITFTKENNQ